MTTTPKPIDDEIVIPPPSTNKDADYLTRDIEAALEAVVRDLITAEMRTAQVRRRQAAANVFLRLKAQLKERTVFLRLKAQLKERTTP